MGKVIFRLPSKGTQYGYAEYSFDADFDDSGHSLGVMYKHFVDNFQRGEAAGQAESRASVKPRAVVSEVITEAEVYAALSPDAPEDVQADAEQMLIDGLGASVYDEPVEQEEEPWEAPPPKPADDDWDF